MRRIRRHDGIAPRTARDGDHIRHAGLQQIVGVVAVPAAEHVAATEAVEDIVEFVAGDGVGIASADDVVSRVFGCKRERKPRVDRLRGRLREVDRDRRRPEGEIDRVAAPRRIVDGKAAEIAGPEGIPVVGRATIDLRDAGKCHRARSDRAGGRQGGPNRADAGGGERPVVVDPGTAEDATTGPEQNAHVDDVVSRQAEEIDHVAAVAPLDREQFERRRGERPGDCHRVVLRRCARVAGRQVDDDVGVVLECRRRKDDTVGRAGDLAPAVGHRGDLDGVEARRCLERPGSDFWRQARLLHRAVMGGQHRSRLKRRKPWRQERGDMTATNGRLPTAAVSCGIGHPPAGTQDRKQSGSVASEPAAWEQLHSVWTERPPAAAAEKLANTPCGLPPGQKPREQSIQPPSDIHSITFRI